MLLLTRVLQRTSAQPIRLSPSWNISERNASVASGLPKESMILKPRAACSRGSAARSSVLLSDPRRYTLSQEDSE